MTASERPPSHVSADETGVEVDAALLAEAFEIAPHEVQDLMRQGLITSRLERGIGEDEGRMRLLFFHGSRRLTLIADETGAILRRSVVDFGEQEMPAALRRR